MEKALVSVITPCYNMENVLYRLMDSIIFQTYRPIEFILVNDGSTDHSLTIAENYRQKFIQANVRYIIVHQENKGLGGAINAGLSHVTGEYICWPDADDFLEPSSIEQRVVAFRTHPNCAVVSSNAYVLQEKAMDSKGLLVNDNLCIHAEPQQFKHLLNDKSIFCPGCHMVKADAFFEVNPDKRIFPAKRGQNWQMLLPLYFKYDRFFLNEPLYDYVIYHNSMSRNDNDFERKLYRFHEHETIIQETLKKIQAVQNTDMSKYINYIAEKYSKHRMELAVTYGKLDEFLKEYKKKKDSIGLDFEDKLFFTRIKYPALNKPLSWICRAIRYIRRHIPGNLYE